MKKRTFKTMIGVLCVFMLIGMTACKKKNDSTDTSSKDTGKITVTFMNGEDELGKVSIDSGKSIEESEYSSFEKMDGYEFAGWYEAPSLLESSLKDLSKDTFSKDTTLYGNFKPNNVTEDKRNWYIAGTSVKGLLKDSNFADADATDDIKSELQLKPTGNANEFSITLDLFKDDQFQIIHDWAWDGQKGFGCITSVDSTQVESGGGIGETSDTANANVIMDGNYTITLTTNPDNEAQDTLTVVRNGDVTTNPSVEENTEYTVNDKTIVKVKGSWVADWSELKDLERTDGSNIYTIKMDLDTDTEFCFMVFDGDSDTGIVLKEENVTDSDSLKLLTATGNNIKILSGGTYTFAVDMDNMTVKITK